MKSGIISLDKNIDYEQSVKNGQEICRMYKPLIACRLKQKMSLPMRTGSLIQVSNDISNNNSLEKQYLRRIEQETDQIENLLHYIDNIISKEERVGKILKYHLVDDLTDEEIAEKLKISRRSVYPDKKNGYIYIAYWANKIEYIHMKTLYLKISYPDLYNLLE